MPDGSEPATLSVARGNPLVLTTKLNEVPTVALAVVALVIAGASSTLSANVCDREPDAFVAWNVTE
jgi:hypothetical protein